MHDEKEVDQALEQLNFEWPCEYFSAQLHELRLIRQAVEKIAANQRTRLKLDSTGPTDTQAGVPRGTRRKGSRNGA